MIGLTISEHHLGEFNREIELEADLFRTAVARTYNKAGGQARTLRLRALADDVGAKRSAILKKERVWRAKAHPKARTTRDQIDPLSYIWRIKYQALPVHHARSLYFAPRRRAASKRRKRGEDEGDYRRRVAGRVRFSSYRGRQEVRGVFRLRDRSRRGTIFIRQYSGGRGFADGGGDSSFIRPVYLPTLKHYPEHEAAAYRVIGRVIKKEFPRQADHLLATAGRKAPTA